MRGAHPNNFEIAAAENKTLQCFAAEVVQMLWHQITIARAQQSDRQRAHVRNQNEAVSAWTQAVSRPRKESARLCQVLKDGPERDCIESSRIEIEIEKGASRYGHTTLLCVIQRRARHICAQKGVVSWKASGE